MRFEVRNQGDAERVLKYFNDFHDAFLETLVVRVISEHEGGFEYGSPVRYEVDLQLVEHKHPARDDDGQEQGRIALRFGDVLGLNVGDFVPLDTMLQSSELEVDDEGVIRFDLGGDSLVTFSSRSLTIEELESSGERAT